MFFYKNKLHILAQEENENAAFIAEILINNGYDVNIKEEDYEEYGLLTPLHVAIIHENVEMVKTFIRSGANVNEKIEKCSNKFFEGCSCLHLSTTTEITEILLKNGAEINNLDANGHSPLWHSIINEDFEVSKILIRFGSDVNIKSKTLNTSMLKYLVKFENSFETKKLSELLIENGTEVNETFGLAGATPMYHAVIYNNIDIVKLLKQKGADETIKSKMGISPVNLAYLVGYKDAIDYFNSVKTSKFVKTEFYNIDNLLKTGNMNEITKYFKSNTKRINIRNSDGFDPLHVVCGCKKITSTDMLSNLIGFGSYVNNNYTYGDGFTPLILSINTEKYHFVEKLIEFGANVNETCFGSKYETFSPLAFSIENKNVDISKLLICNGAEVNFKLMEELTCLPLLHMCVDNNDVEHLELLLSNGGDVNILDESGNTILHRYIYNNFMERKKKYNEEIMEIIFKYDIQTKIRNSDGRSALDLCYNLKQYNIAKAILVHSANKIGCINLSKTCRVKNEEKCLRVSKKLKKDVGHRDICSICIEELKIEEEIRQLCKKCYFHKKCIDKWFLNDKNFCPNCRNVCNVLSDKTFEAINKLII